MQNEEEDAGLLSVAFWVEQNAENLKAFKGWGRDIYFL